VDESACAGALKSREQVIIEDVLSDSGFAPYRDIARAADFRSVQSTPLVSSNGALVGILSTHFSLTHCPPREQRQALKGLGRLAADAIIRCRIQVQMRQAWQRAHWITVQRSKVAIDHGQPCSSTGHQTLTSESSLALVWRVQRFFCCGANVRFWHKADLWRRLPDCPLSARSRRAARERSSISAYVPSGSEVRSV